MSNLSKIAAVVLIVLALILGLFAYKLSRTSQAPAAPVSVPALAESVTSKPDVVFYPVLVAARDLVAGQPLAVDDLRVEQWQVQPTSSLPEPALAQGELLRFDVAQGEPVTRHALMRGLAKHLREGERAVTIPLDEQTGASAHIVPGDLVDIFLTFKQGSEVDDTQARLLQSRQRVLAYGIQSVDGPERIVTPEGDSRSNRAPRASQANAAPRTAVLAVPVSQVNELLLATRTGQLQLVLRAPTDEAAPDAALFPERDPVLSARKDLSAEQKDLVRKGENLAFAGESLRQLGGSAAEEEPKQVVQAPRARAVSAQPPAARSIEVVRGTQRERVPY